MRSLVLVALLGTSIASTHLAGQSLSEHAAAAAGATIGTAAGKPLGTSLGKIFSDVDKSSSTAATPKTAKPVASKPAPVAAPDAAHAAAPAPVIALAGGDDSPAGGGGTSSSSSSSSRRVGHRKQPELAPVAAEPIAPVTPIVAEPVVKEPTVQDVASIKVGATASELRATLGPPESKVSIPDDDGHLLEICQYWSKGEQIGTIRLDNGRVVSVQTNN